MYVAGDGPGVAGKHRLGRGPRGLIPAKAHCGQAGRHGGCLGPRPGPDVTEKRRLMPIPNHTDRAGGSLRRPKGGALWNPLKRLTSFR